MMIVMMTREDSDHPSRVMTEGGTKLKGPDSRLHRDTFLSPYQAKLWQWARAIRAWQLRLSDPRLTRDSGRVTAASRSHNLSRRRGPGGCGNVTQLAGSAKILSHDF